MSKPYMIGIAGESGVGKSTMTNIVSLFYGINNTAIISTDDLHKWDRDNEIWKNITHLNPEANNLELGDIHLLSLSRGEPIYRSVYNHNNGKFNPPIKIIPNKIIITEGLHAYYTENSKNLINLKIFVNTNEDLRTHWKIIRDINERGYEYNSVIDSINRRRADGEILKKNQIKEADIIISIDTEDKIKNLGDKNEKIKIKINIENKNNKDINLCDFIINYFNKFNEFINMCDLVGGDITLCQDGGGNISYKISDEYMIIKSSGFKLKDVSKSNGYSVINYKNIQESKIFNDKELENNTYKSLIFSENKKPSMESGFHTVLDDCVVHTHPIYLTFILCLEDSKNIIKNLYNKYNYHYIDYLSPGYHLYDSIKKLDKKNIYFLENHGLIVSSNNLLECYKYTVEINNIAKEYIKNKYKAEDFNISYAEKNIEHTYTFPDSVLFLDDNKKQEIIAAHNYILHFSKITNNIRKLKENDISYLKNLESEKYRKKL